MACLQRSEDHVRCESPPPTMFETGSFWRSLLCKPTAELTGFRASSNSPASALPSHQRSMGWGGKRAGYRHTHILSFMRVLEIQSQVLKLAL